VGALVRVVYRGLDAVNGSCEAERIFTKLKWILGRLKTNMGETLNALMMIAHNFDMAEYLAEWRKETGGTSEKVADDYRFTFE
jgi:hypothetical protein